MRRIVQRVRPEPEIEQADHAGEVEELDQAEQQCDGGNAEPPAGAERHDSGRDGDENAETVACLGDVDFDAAGRMPHDVPRERHCAPAP